MSLPLQIESITEMRAWVRAAQLKGESVGLIPTMGALHDGHLSLVRAAAQGCDHVVATVFVNPTQFAPNEDYDSYPRSLESDAVKLASAGAQVMFTPTVDAMYPGESETIVDVGSITKTLEGALRPKHFRGVATVVLKLLNIAPADRAYFGQKDYQQTVVLRRMVQDLDLPVEMVICPIVREPDGVAMSSRNARLTPDQRRDAVVLSKSLQLAERLVAEGERRVDVIRPQVEALFIDQPGVELDYAAFVADGTVTPVEEITGPTVLAIAARLGKTRLLDNTRLV
jgi:pantoate--beta-alanine ligase